MTPAKHTNLGLHLVRGCCALGVAGYHYLNWAYGLDVQSVGTFYVYTFFILSALTLTMVHSREFSGSVSFDDLRRFYIKRCARILPLLAGIALFGAVEGSLRSGSWQFGTFAKAFLTGSTLFGLQLPAMMSSVVAAWSLGIEAVFYLVFPIAALAFANMRPAGWWGMVAILILAQQCAIYLISGSDGATFFFHYANPLVFAPFFAIGIGLTRIEFQQGSRYLVLAVLCLAAVPAIWLVFPVRVTTTPLMYLLLTAIAATAVLASRFAAIPRALQKAAAYLGEISYSLYLTHWYSFRLTTWAAAELQLNDAIRMCLFAAVSLAVATAVTTLFERPAQALILHGLGIAPKRPIIPAPVESAR